MFRGILLLVFGVFATFCSIKANSESLTEALGKAYWSNPSLQAARAKLRSFDEKVSEAKSGWRPKLSLDFDIGKKRIDSGKGWQNRTPRTGSINVEQSLFDGWRTKWNVDRANEEVFEQRAQLLVVEQNILFEAVTAYMDVIRDEAVLKLNQNNELVLRRQLEASRDRFEVGEITRTDVAQAEARLSRAIADKIQANGFLSMSRAAYRRIIGDHPGTLKDVPLVKELPRDKQESISLAKFNNPEILRLIHQEKGAKFAIKKAEGELYPTIDLDGEIKRKDEATSRTSSSEEASIIATISLPLYEGGGVSARIRSAKQNWVHKRRNLDVAVSKVEQDAAQSWESYVTSKARVEALSSEVRAAQIALDGVKQEAEVGSRSVLDVLDAGQEVLDARVSLVRARREVTVASYRLRRSVGTLIGSKLNLGVKLYDPLIYYERAKDSWFGKSIN